MKMLRSKYCLIILLSQVFIIPAFGITANFSYTKVSNCAPTIVRFTNNSTRGTGINYIWDFGLGAIVTATDYSMKEQLYTKAGKYTVTLKVTDGINTDSFSDTITISRGPAANFTVDPGYGCPPLLVKYTSISIPGDSDIIKTSWDLRNGNFYEGTSVQFPYNSPGIYGVVLKVTDKNGCSSIFESDDAISVTEKPKINFTASDTFACTPPVNISFTNLSKGSSGLTYNWDFGNGKTSTDLSNSTVYDTIGSYSVKLKATDQTGCSDSLIKESYITIGYRKGTLSVYDGHNNIVNRSFLCDGTYRFVFSNAGLPDYTWRITDNNTTSTFTGKNSITYQVKGSGTVVVKLIYGKNSFCTDSITRSFPKSFIKAAFALDDTLLCSLPSKINLNNSSQNADKIAWYLSGKLISDQNDTSYTLSQKDLPEETYKQLYNHEINMTRLPFKLVASNGGVCYDSVVNEITIALPLARFMPDKVSGCVPLQVSFSDSSKSVFGIDNYKYKIGSDSVIALSKTPVNYTFTLPGVYDVSEIIKSGICYDTSEIVRIVAGDKLVPDFTVSPAEICNGGSIHLTGNAGNNPGVSIWRFRSANLFDLSFVSRPDTVITVYSDSSGYKDISLQVDNWGCISETTKKNILKINGPVGNFTQSFNCDSSLIYHFKSKISPATSLTWNIDTAIINNVDSLNYLFPSSGNYTVKLTASDNSSNCTLIRTKLLNVRRVMADFTLTDTIFCAGDSVKLDASSSRDFIKTCYNEGFLWDFGDGSPPRRTFLSNYGHVYSAKGTDTIKLIVTADNGCTDTTRKVIHVFRPTASFTTDKTSGCVPAMSINFKNTSTDSSIVSWIWKFGDKSSDSTNTVNISHLYSGNEQKTFYPSLIVYDAYQCPAGYAIPVELIGINGNFQADDNAVCIGQQVVFTPVDSSLTNLNWDFGDNSISGSESIHTYDRQGQFTVSLTSSKEGCSKTIIKSNYISVEKANAAFTVSDSVLFCYPDTLSFAHNNLIDSPAVDYLWTFGSNSLTDRTSGNVKYIFTRPGNYQALLTVRTLNGCTAASSKQIAISGPTAAVSFSPDKICYNDVVNFKLDSLKNASQWKWLFGDGSTSTDNPVSHRYTSRGKIIPSIQLISGDCHAISVLDTLSVSRVRAGFNSSDSSQTICFGNKLNLLNSSISSDSWSWAIDNVQVSTGYDLSDILFNSTGDYNIRLIARESGGCSDTLIKKFSVVPNPVFSITGDSILCSGMNSVMLSVNSVSGWSIRWTPSSGLSNPSAFVTSATPADSTTYTALVTDANGCTSGRTKTILVNQPFDLSRFPLSDTTINIGERIQLIVLTSANNVSYTWSPHENISCLHCNNPWVAPTETVTYTVETKNDCFDFFESFIVEVIRDFYLEAPSAFTPNGDSNNDLFMFEEKNIKNFDLKIFNRWGEIVFSTNDLHEGWDGNVNGHAQNIDTYKYAVKAETIHGYKFEKRGEFLLLK